jgi:aminoglycoside 9-adenylyltransferase
MNESIDFLLYYFEQAAPGNPLGVYLFGSATLGGLQPDSDIDLLLVTQRSLDMVERRELVNVLLEVSGWSGHAERFPEAESRRPVELTSVVAADMRPIQYPPRRDFQYGEWLRADYLAGRILPPAPDPDLTVVVSQALSSHRVLRGPALRTVVDPPSADMVRRAMRESIPELLSGIRGDERNVLLTLARIIVTLQSGEIVAKDEAAARVGPQLPDSHRILLELARAGYLGEAADDWAAMRSQACKTASYLAAEARRLTS